MATGPPAYILPRYITKYHHFISFVGVLLSVPVLDRQVSFFKSFKKTKFMFFKLANITEGGVLATAKPTTKPHFPWGRFQNAVDDVVQKQYPGCPLNLCMYAYF